MELRRDNMNDLGALMDEIHDRHFSLNQLIYDERAGRLSIGLREKKRGPCEKTLTITCVKSYRVDDRERINTYYVNMLRPDLVRGQIHIDCDLMDIWIEVTPDFAILLEPVRPDDSLNSSCRDAPVDL